MISTDEGMQIDESDEQHASADSPIRESLDSFSKLTFNKATHTMKQFLQMISTDEGIQIDKSDEQPPNADSPIRESLDSLSKLTIERVSESQKLSSQMRSTEEGIQISHFTSFDSRTALFLT
jgi:hypothetical protein